MKEQTEAGIVSIRDNPNEFTARINLRWQGDHEISDFDLDKLGKILNSESETENTGWVLVERPIKVDIGKTIPLVK